MDRLIDRYGREVTYLRLSVTEKCNLNCFYCRGNGNFCVEEPGQIDDWKIFFKIVKAAASLGINKVRLTGGEPLIFPNLLDLVKNISLLGMVDDLSMTTNGVLLPSFALPLAQAGLTRVNISLDSLQGLKFKKITKGGVLKDVLKGIKEALKAGLTPVKINMVLLKGINDDEIKDFVELTIDQELDVRFIEYMPVGEQHDTWSDYFVPLDKVKDVCLQIGPIEDAQTDHGAGPARYFKIKGAVGKIGLISPLSRHFCRTCNRLRVTADAKIKPCLFSDQEIDLRPYVNADISVIRKKILEAVYLKTDPNKVGNDPLTRMKECLVRRAMSQIGG